MRNTLFFLALLSGCSGEANHLGNPLMVPISGLATAASNAVYSQRRGAVEVFVKTNHPALINEIDLGGGPVLTDAMDIAEIPLEDRPARIIQLQSNLGLYEVNLGAFVTALMVYGG